MQALLEQLPQDSSPVVAIVKSTEPGSPNPAKSNGNRGTTSSYNPSVLYILELATVMAMKNKDSSIDIGKDVVEALLDVLRDSKTWHPIVISRAVFYLLNLLNACHVSI